MSTIFSEWKQSPAIDSSRASKMAIEELMRLSQLPKPNQIRPEHQALFAAPKIEPR